MFCKENICDFRFVKQRLFKLYKFFLVDMLYASSKVDIRPHSTLAYAAVKPTLIVALH